MDLKELTFTRNFGDKEKDLALNLMKTIAESTEGRIAFSPLMIGRVQSAHDTLELFRKKKATEKQVLDTFARVGLVFYHWLTSTNNQIQIEAAKAVDDPLGSLIDPDAQEAAVEAILKQDEEVLHMPKGSNIIGITTAMSTREFQENLPEEFDLPEVDIFSTKKKPSP